MPIALAGRTRLFTLASATKTGNWRTPRRGDFRGRHRDGQRIAESAAHPSAFFWVCPWAMAVCATLTTNRRKPPKPSAWCSRSAITQEPHLSLIQPAASGCFRFKLLIKYTVSVLFLPWRRTRWVSRAIRRAPGNSACAGVVSWRSSRRILRRTRLTSRVSARVSEVGRGGARGGFPRRQIGQGIAWVQFQERHSGWRWRSHQGYSGFLYMVNPCLRVRDQ